MEPRELATEPISPELALVDPDLAARARAALPEHPWPAPVRFELPPDGRPATRDGTPLAATLWTLGFGLAVVLVIFGLSVIPAGDRPTFAAEGDAIPAAGSAPTSTHGSEPAAPRARQSQVTKAKPAPKTVTTPRRDRARTRTRSKPAATAKAKPRVVRTPRTPRRTRRTPVPAFKPARLFSWPPRAGAVYYQVTFVRNGRPLYRARARSTRLRLPSRVRFTPGRYRWTVQPAIAGDLGVRLVDPIVDSTFQVTGD